MQLLLVDGRASKLHRNAEQHAALERGDGLIPWKGSQVWASLDITEWRVHAWGVRRAAMSKTSP